MARGGSSRPWHARSAWLLLVLMVTHVILQSGIVARQRLGAPYMDMPADMNVGEQLRAGNRMQLPRTPWVIREDPERRERREDANYADRERRIEAVLHDVGQHCAAHHGVNNIDPACLPPYPTAVSWIMSHKIWLREFQQWKHLLQRLDLIPPTARCGRNPCVMCQCDEFSVGARVYTFRVTDWRSACLADWRSSRAFRPKQPRACYISGPPLSYKRPAAPSCKRPAALSCKRSTAPPRESHNGQI